MVELTFQLLQVDDILWSADVQSNFYIFGVFSFPHNFLVCFTDNLLENKNLAVTAKKLSVVIHLGHSSKIIRN